MILKKPYVLISTIILLTAILYWPSFTSPFFQDDVIFLKSPKITDIFTTIPDGIWRPLSFQVFYTAGKFLFGLNPLPFHLILFFFSSLSLFLIFSLSKKIFKGEKKALVSVFLYALNISLFANFYWVATSYFVLGGFFIFLSLYFFFCKNSVYLSVISFILSLLSNEIAFVLPLLLILFSWYLKKFQKSLVVFGLIDLVYIYLKALHFGLPQKSVYKIEFLSFFANFRWYLFRAFNLPEGIKRSSDLTIFLLFMLFLILFILGFYLRFKSGKLKYRLPLFSFLFFIFGAFPFFFLPMHMSSYYLTVSLLGSSLLFSEIFSVNSKILIFSLLVYLLLSVRGLTFLQETHWIILKNTGPIGILLK